ncbi:uncharacterized protein TRUGW13939_10988 [Talaromyces rugulosus]|uniref:Uncharacterized protein n=1 Tax=Talaromyces rugulosus TaxID=121627 RepID=A0A7H8RCK7_TALRU|nr:uncharacterized protein TRUGW13939_10988 [Talaromyces rugulosus]QKX63817.1 hypothetical protein TRUGW13939_10988 [Talaromyces rugulosus]
MFRPQGISDNPMGKLPHLQGIARIRICGEGDHEGLKNVPTSVLPVQIRSLYPDDHDGDEGVFGYESDDSYLINMTELEPVLSRRPTRVEGGSPRPGHTWLQNVSFESQDYSYEANDDIDVDIANILLGCAFQKFVTLILRNGGASKNAKLFVHEPSKAAPTFLLLADDSKQALVRRQ